MILLAVIAALAVVAAIGFFAQASRDRHHRLAAERRAAELEGRSASAAEARRRLVGVAAHELRSPISVVMGYLELIGDGLYGELDRRGQDAIARVRMAVEQQLRILDGTVDLAGGGRTRGDGAAPFQLEPLFRSVLADARAFGLAYNVVIEVDRRGDLPTIVADADRFRRALDMTLTAAVKGSPGKKLLLRIAPADSGADIRVSGTGLDPARDDPGGEDGAPFSVGTGAALRIAIARRALGTDGGSIALQGEAEAATLEIRLRGDAPQIDGGEARG